jgi:hypothetical protein
MRLALKNPFWGAQKLIDLMDDKIMTALQDRPEGFVLTVCGCDVSVKINGTLFRDHINHHQGRFRGCFWKKGWCQGRCCTSPC